MHDFSPEVQKCIKKYIQKNSFTSFQYSVQEPKKFKLFCSHEAKECNIIKIQLLLNNVIYIYIYSYIRNNNHNWKYRIAFNFITNFQEQKFISIFINQINVIFL